MPGQFCTTCVPNYFNGKRPCSWLQASWRIVKGLSQKCRIAEHAGSGRRILTQHRPALYWLAVTSFSGTLPRPLNGGYTRCAALDALSMSSSSGSTCTITSATCGTPFNT